MNDIRKNGTVGIVEYKQMNDKNSYIHFSEWWNGEGLDVTLSIDDKDDEKISLHLDDIHALVTAFIASGMVDVRECKFEAEKMIHESENREMTIKKIRQKNEKPTFDF